MSLICATKTTRFTFCSKKSRKKAAEYLWDKVTSVAFWQDEDWIEVLVRDADKVSAILNKRGYKTAISAGTVTARAGCGLIRG